MLDPLRQSIEKLLDGEHLTAELMHATVLEIMEGGCSEPSIAALLTGLRIKGEEIPEIAGAARAMREKATRIPTGVTGALDTCGTGGSRLDTFNVSTATAIVAAACGVPVAKHGNRGATSRSGSSDVLEQLGVNLTLGPDRVGRCLDEIGICFCFAPLLHSAMKYVVPVRKALGFRTIFNLLGPLTNPAGAEYQLLGTVSNSFARKIAGALHELGTRRATVVCGAEQLDEVGLWGTTLACRVTSDGVAEETWSAETFGLPECSVEDVRIDSPQASAALIEQIFAGEAGPPRNIVLANAAAALYTAGQADDLKQGVARAADAIDGGAARTKLRELAETSHRLATAE